MLGGSKLTLLRTSFGSGVDETVRLCSVKRITRGRAMSKQYQAITSKYLKYPKNIMHQYLYNSGEPSDGNYDSSLSDLDVGLIEDSYFMKRHFRNIAHRMRS
jgi:hypothetical protein